MSRDEEYYDHRTITVEGKLVEGKTKPRNWAIHYHEVRDDRQWTTMTYRFEAQINPEISFNQAQEAISKSRTTGQEIDKGILAFLEKMAKNKKRATVESLFAVKK
jgi:hypothetical protein